MYSEVYGRRVDACLLKCFQPYPRRVCLASVVQGFKARSTSWHYSRLSTNCKIYVTIQKETESNVPHSTGIVKLSSSAQRSIASLKLTIRPVHMLTMISAAVPVIVASCPSQPKIDATGAGNVRCPLKAKCSRSCVACLRARGAMTPQNRSVAAMPTMQAAKDPARLLPLRMRGV